MNWHNPHRCHESTFSFLAKPGKTAAMLNVVRRVKCIAQKNRTASCQREPFMQVNDVELLSFTLYWSSVERFVHLSWAKWPLRAVVLVNSAPHRGQYDFVAVPDFSRWCLSKLLKVENWRPLQPCSQHWGLERGSSILMAWGSSKVEGVAEGRL